MNAIAMVHKMQRLALTGTGTSSSNMDVDESPRIKTCDTIREESDVEEEGTTRWLTKTGSLLHGFPFCSGFFFDHD